LSACSPFGKGGWRGILRIYAYLLFIKSPLAPLFQRGDNWGWIKRQFINRLYLTITREGIKWQVVLYVENKE